MSHSSRRLTKIVPALLVLVAALIIGCGGSSHSTDPTEVSTSVPIGGGGTVTGASGSGSGTGGSTGGSTGDIVTATTAGTTSTTTTTGTTGLTG